jgi:GNAT superfamily N-acetyltransferase
MGKTLEGPAPVIYCTSPSVTSEALNALFAAAWPGHAWRDFSPILEQSLAYVCAFHEGRLVGFVNLAWDGGIHAFVLDTTVHPALRRRGVGSELIKRAAAAAREQGVVWLHADFEPHLLEFYRRCGFRHTEAGLLRLKSATCTGP